MGYTKKLFICPFYTSNDKGVVRCQGGNICLHNNAELRKYYIKYCASDNWEKCSIAKSLVNFYENSKSVPEDLKRRNVGWMRRNGRD